MDPACKRFYPAYGCPSEDELSLAHQCPSESWCLSALQAVGTNYSSRLSLVAKQGTPHPSLAWPTLPPPSPKAGGTADRTFLPGKVSAWWPCGSLQRRQPSPMVRVRLQVWVWPGHGTRTCVQGRGPGATIDPCQAGLGQAPLYTIIHPFSNRSR